MRKKASPELDAGASGDKRLGGIRSRRVKETAAKEKRRYVPRPCFVDGVQWSFQRKIIRVERIQESRKLVCFRKKYVMSLSSGNATLFRENMGSRD